MRNSPQAAGHRFRAVQFFPGAFDRGLRSMDMQCALPARLIDSEPRSPGAECARLMATREHLCTLIAEFRKAVTRPDGLNDAVKILQAILPWSDAYFSIVESLLDKITAAGAAPHRGEHLRILREMTDALERCGTAHPKRRAADLAHALDALVMHEAAIRLREALLNA
jgi:hypothetical protein